MLVHASTHTYVTLLLQQSMVFFVAFVSSALARSTIDQPTIDQPTMLYASNGQQHHANSEPPKSTQNMPSVASQAQQINMLSNTSRWDEVRCVIMVPINLLIPKYFPPDRPRSTALNRVSSRGNSSDLERLSQLFGRESLSPRVICP
jgi:hypothetical protein